MKSYNKADKNWVLLGLIIPILVFLSCASGVFAYFTANSQFQSSVSVPKLILNFSNGNTINTSSTLSGSTVDTQYFVTNSVNHTLARVVPGDTITIKGTLNNSGSLDAYAILDFKLYVTKLDSSEVCMEHKIYTFDEGVLTELVYNSSTHKYSNACVFEENESANFSISYNFDILTYDNEYQQATSRYEINAYGLQADYLTPEGNETVAEFATRTLIDLLEN